MKKAFIFILTALTISAGVAQKKSPHDSIRYFVIQPSAGYTTFALGDVRDFYKSVLDVFDMLGLHIPTQKEYPGNVIFGLTGMYNIPSVLRIGLGSQYTWTKAYSGYEDYAGLFEVNSKISMLTIEGVIERDIETTPTVNIFFGARGGFSFVSSDYSNTISLNDFSALTETISLRGDGRGYSVEGYVGFSRVFNTNFIVDVTAGYRVASVKELEGKMTIPGEGSYSGELDLEHDLSGVVLNVKVGYRFNLKP